MIGRKGIAAATFVVGLMAFAGCGDAGSGGLPPDPDTAIDAGDAAPPDARPDAADDLVEPPDGHVGDTAPPDAPGGDTAVGDAARPDVLPPVDAVLPDAPPPDGDAASAPDVPPPDSDAASAPDGAGPDAVPPHCTTASDCPPPATPCLVRSCAAGECTETALADGTPIPEQAAGDCLLVVCDGAGATRVDPAADDLPDDGNACTDDLCIAGEPAHEPLPAFTPCGDALFCDGAGDCVGCLAASDCPGEDTDCRTRECVDGTCAFRFADAGTVVESADIPGDCLETVCDGAGGTQDEPAAADLPFDDNACTADLCEAAGPANPALPAGTPCTETDGRVCDGAGACVGCLTASDCPGEDGECAVRVCVETQCDWDFAAAGTALNEQIGGDCQLAVCDGSGGPGQQTDPTDVPDDSNQCTVDECVDGLPQTSSAPVGTSCTEGGGRVCDGAGACVGCVGASDCPGEDNECATRTCVAFACGVSFAAAGVPVAAQAEGDCRQAVCDGQGRVVDIPDDADLPTDGRQCTDDVCAAGVPFNPPFPGGTACSEDGGVLCDGAGTCVECLSATDCPGEDEECTFRDCWQNVCGFIHADPGVPLADQVEGDCQLIVCDGSGGVTTQDDPSDTRPDDSECTADLCIDGQPISTPLPAGAPCGGGGARVCDGMGRCVSQHFVVLRVGDGATALSNAAAPLFLEWRDGTGALVARPNNPLPLPIAADGAQQPITLSGTATSEGFLSLSSNGNYITLAGYAATPGTPGVSSSAAPRVVARVDASGNIDTSTVLTGAFLGNNVRSATSDDGSGFWAAGTGSAGSAGIQYVAFGEATPVQVLATPNNARVAHVYGGQLYGSSGSGTFINVFSVGTGLPTTAGQTATPLPGMPSSGAASPYDYVLLDREPDIAGLDTLYVADDRSVGAGGGVQKWVLDDATWVLVATFNAGLTSGVRGLAGQVTGGVILVATTAETGANRVMLLYEQGSNPPMAVPLATAPTNTAFRGLAVAPF